MSTLADFRRKYPQYDDMDDAELAEALHQKYYSDLPKEDVFKRLAVRPTEAAPAPMPAPAPPTSTRVTAPPKEVKPAGIFDYFTDRQAAIKQDREYRAYLQDKMQRAELEDIETQTGFFDRLGDLFSRGLLTARSGIKDVEAAIEADPTLKKQFTQEARKFAADSRAEITGATTEQDVKDNFLRNAIPYIIEKGAESLPQMFASTNPLGVLGVALPSNLGGQAREAAELQGRQDVSGADVAKVAPGALAVTALDTLGLGGILAAPAKTALGRIGKAALLEGGTEAIQSAIEYANPRVVTGSDIDAGELFEQAAFGALAGGGIGGGLRGVGEIAAAPFRRKAEAQPSSLAADSPEVEQEYLRLVAAEAQALVDADPNLTQRQAFNQVMKGDTVGKLYDTAVANILLGPEEGTDVDTGVDVTGGSGASVAPDIEPAPTKTGAPDLGEVVGGRLERPVPSVSVPDVGAGARVAPLIEPTAAQVKATVPVIEQTFEAAALDFDDTYGVKKLNAEQKKQAARIVIQSPEVDPYDAIGSVLERGVALRGEKPKKAPSISRVAPAAPAVAAPNLTAEQKTAIATMPDLGSIPRLTQTDAPVEAAPVAPPAQRTMNDMAGIGTVNPENTNEVLVEGGGIQLTPLADDILKVDSLRAVEKGGGRKAMTELTKAADTNGAALQLSPEPFEAEAGKEMSPTELTEWYRGFGFQEQPDGTMVRPAAPTPSTITAAPEFTPQQIVENLDVFAGDAARDQGYDTGMFREGVADIQRGRELLTDQQIIDASGPEALDAYKAGIGWAQERIAEAQTTPAATPVEAAPIEDADTATRSAESSGSIVGGTDVDIDAFRGRTLDDLLNHIASNTDGKYSEFDTRLADRLNSLLFQLQDAGFRVTLNVLQKGDAAPTSIARGSARGVASINLKTQTVDVYLRSPDLGNSGGTTEIILHEALHAVSMGILMAVKRGRGTPEMVKFRKDLNDLRNKVIDHFNRRVKSVGKEGLTDFERSMYTRNTNAFADIDEFLAWGMTNKLAQDYLRSIEAGPRKSLFDKFVDAFRSLLGIDVNDTSALAHLVDIVSPLFSMTAQDYKTTISEQSEGASAAIEQGPPKVVSGGKVVKLTEAQTRTALAKAKATREKMNRIQKRIARTNDTADILGDGIELTKLARGDKENWALLRGAIDTLNVGKWRVILPTLSTEDIFRALKGRIPGLIDADRTIRQDIAKFQTKEYLQLANELETVAEFLKQHPRAAQALSDLEFATVAYQVDPTKAATPEEYFTKVDGRAEEVRTKLKTEKDPKKKKNLEAKLKTRFGEIESVYKGVPGDERVIGWRDLARPEFGGNKGKEIFKLLRDAHRRDLEAKYNALRERLIETKKEEDLDEALEKLEERFKPAREQVIYFPAMRFGSYYARVGKGANSIFKMFETETERNQFVRLMQSRGEDITDTGNVEDLRNNFEQVTGGPLKEVLDLFDDNPKDIGALKSQVFDLWLQTMSAGDMRKHMAPRKMRAGYSTDILKNFANFRRSSINDVKRARYGYKLRTDISRARDLIKEMPDREKLDTFIKEIELRTLSDLMPPDRGSPVWEQAIQFGNKMAFYQYLANPKTAVIQLTQMHIVALPILAQKYGSAKATAALAKYGFSSLGGFVVSPLTSVKKKDGSWSFNWEQPNLLDNPISSLKEESDPELYEVLSEGWAAGRDTNLYMDTFANDIGGFAMVDPEQRSALQELTSGRPLTAALRGATFTFEAMGALMHQMERVNREATYMAALELAYRENKKKGQSHAEAKKNAIDAATDTTLAATFDFSSYNKPRVLTTPVGRISGQFFSYPYMMSSLMVRNMYTAIKFGKLEPGERMAAAQVATGTMVNIGLYAGLTGIPLYGLFKVIGSMLAWLFDDDEEEGGLSYVDADGNIKATYDIDWWFRNVWIPKFFGPEGTVANLFGLDDDTAATLALSMEKGPISAITDIDLANSVALDFMFFVPREPRADTAEGKIVEYTFSGLTGAFGNAVMDYVKAGKDLMNGYTSRALEKAPKLYGNIAKANRFAEEGQLNYNRELVGMDADFWTSDKAILQGLGFASTEAAQRQQQNYEGRTITEKVKKAREGMLSKIRRVALDGYQYGYTPEVMAERQKVMEEWAEFNQTYPTDVIGVDTLYEVQTNAITDALKSKATRGVPLDEKGKTPYLQDIFLRRVEAEE